VGVPTPPPPPPPPIPPAVTEMGHPGLLAPWLTGPELFWWRIFKGDPREDGADGTREAGTEGVVGGVLEAAREAGAEGVWSMRMVGNFAVAGAVGGVGDVVDVFGATSVCGDVRSTLFCAAARVTTLLHTALTREIRASEVCSQMQMRVTLQQSDTC